MGLARAGCQVAEVTLGTTCSDVALASARGKVVYEGLIADANADAVVDCGVPDLIEVAVAGKRFANAITMVKVHVSVGALLVRARQRVVWVRCARLHELGGDLTSHGRGRLDGECLHGTTGESCCEEKVRHFYYYILPAAMKDYFLQFCTLIFSKLT